MEEKQQTVDDVISPITKECDFVEGYTDQILKRLCDQKEFMKKTAKDNISSAKEVISYHEKLIAIADKFESIVKTQDGHKRLAVNLQYRNYLLETEVDFYKTEIAKLREYMNKEI